MSEHKAFASLGPSLLARKGGARPAMRPQLAAILPETAAVEFQPHAEDDLGWNDMGHDQASAAPLPEVVRQQQALSRRIARERRSALDDGRRAAFTLRVDAERHLKLRLACTLRNRSAQQLVTEALDRLLADLPDVADLAAHVARKNRK
ncbi:hypothetical protein [Novosphingobium sp.]|uniref:hypothetical protein n=1 Tax=Novosphingobium sp. TaxID=1874826 RepID=UPI0035AEA57C